MRAFEAVARLGSMRAAADALALTHGAVSRRVAKLSDDLGLELFEPAGRGLRLTAEGQALASAMAGRWPSSTTPLIHCATATPSVRWCCPVNARWPCAG